MNMNMNNQTQLKKVFRRCRILTPIVLTLFVLFPPFTLSAQEPDHIQRLEKIELRYTNGTNYTFDFLYDSMGRLIRMENKEKKASQCYFMEFTYKEDKHPIEIRQVRIDGYNEISEFEYDDDKNTMQIDEGYGEPWQNTYFWKDSDGTESALYRRIEGDGEEREDNYDIDFEYNLPYYNDFPEEDVPENDRLNRIWIDRHTHYYDSRLISLSYVGDRIDRIEENPKFYSDQDSITQFSYDSAGLIEEITYAEDGTYKRTKDYHFEYFSGYTRVDFQYDMGYGDFNGQAFITYSEGEAHNPCLEPVLKISDIYSSVFPQDCRDILFFLEKMFTLTFSG